MNFANSHHSFSSTAAAAAAALGLLPNMLNTQITSTPSQNASSGCGVGMLGVSADNMLNVDHNNYGTSYTQQGMHNAGYHQHNAAATNSAMTINTSTSGRMQDNLAKCATRFNEQQRFEK
jgi:hypothetical protein